MTDPSLSELTLRGPLRLLRNPRGPPLRWAGRGCSGSSTPGAPRPPPQQEKNPISACNGYMLPRKRWKNIVKQANQKFWISCSWLRAKDSTVSQVSNTIGIRRQRLHPATLSADQLHAYTCTLSHTISRSSASGGQLLHTLHRTWRSGEAYVPHPCSLRSTLCPLDCIHETPCCPPTFLTSGC